jgi:hypothetical protein
MIEMIYFSLGILAGFFLGVVATLPNKKEIKEHASR